MCGGLVCSAKCVINMTVLHSITDGIMPVVVHRAMPCTVCGACFAGSTLAQASCHLHESWHVEWPTQVHWKLPWSACVHNIWSPGEQPACFAVLAYDMRQILQHTVPCTAYHVHTYATWWPLNCIAVHLVS